MPPEPVRLAAESIAAEPRRMSPSQPMRHKISVILIAVLAAIALAVGGFVVGSSVAARPSNRFKNTAATRPDAAAMTTVPAPAGPPPAGASHLWSVVRRPD